MQPSMGSQSLYGRQVNSVNSELSQSSGIRSPLTEITINNALNLLSSGEESCIEQYECPLQAEQKTSIILGFISVCLFIK